MTGWSGALWRLGFAGVALAAALATGTAQAACTLGGFTMGVTMEGGRAAVPVSVNGKDTRFWLDSGAWFSIMSQAKATELGLRTEAAPQGLRMSGIGGSFTPMVARIKDFAVNGSMLHNVDFLVGGSDSGNGMIGRNILASADTEFDLAHGVLRLVQAKDCDKANMAYWAGDKPYFTVKLLANRDEVKVPNLSLPILLNGHEVRAEIDTGATTLISRAAAEQAGIDLNGPMAVPIDRIGGFGKRFNKGWRVRLESLSVGDETILRPPLLVIDGPITPGPGSPEMLLGIDFLLAHHLYVSRGQHLIYFTYTGGEPFAHDPRDPKPVKSASAAAVPEGMRAVEGVDLAEAPKSAAEFARRGAARLAQRDAAGAVADLGEAIRLEPGNAEHYRLRSEANAMAGNPALARSDFDVAVKLAPDNPRLRLVRAWMLHAGGDDTGALADLTVARQQTPPSSLDLVQVAELYVELGRAADALPLWDGLIAAHKEDAQLGSLLNGRCWSRGLANTALDAAMADCNRALKLTGNSDAVRDSRALIEFRQNELASARADLDSVLARTGERGWSLYMRGLVRAAQGEGEAGKVDRDKALAQDKAFARRARQYGLEPAR